MSATGGLGAPVRFLVIAIAGYGGVRALTMIPAEDAVVAAKTAPVEAVPAKQFSGETSVIAQLPVEPGPLATFIYPETRIIVQGAWNPAPLPPKRLRANVPHRPSLQPQPVLPGTPIVQAAPQNPQKQDQSKASSAVPTNSIRIATSESKSRRLSGYGWIFVRNGAPASAQLPSLGGGQAGIRLNWRLGPTSRFVVFGRSVTALNRAPDGSFQREGVVGLGYYPWASRSLEIAVERRVALDHGGRNAWQLRLSGGAERDIGVWRVEGYGQAGITGTRRRDGFAEGQVSVRRKVVDRGGARISAGAGVWGGTQRGTGRLDLGPQIVADFKLVVPVRASLDYRFKVAGKAQPRSGAAFTLSTSF